MNKSRAHFLIAQLRDLSSRCDVAARALGEGDISFVAVKELLSPVLQEVLKCVEARK